MDIPELIRGEELTQGDWVIKESQIQDRQICMGYWSRSPKPTEKSRIQDRA